MTVHVWLYVSKSTIPAGDTDRIVGEIVAGAQQRNAALGISGALVFGDQHFGQIIEGPPESIMMLRSSILSDTRHTGIRTITDGRSTGRRFGGWSLAYAGASMVVSRALQRALRDSAQGIEGAGNQLLDLMDEVLAVA